MQPRQEILQRWGELATRLHPHMEITCDGLVLGAGTVLAKMATDKKGATLLVLDNEPRALALLAAAFEEPIDLHVLAKIGRACALWNEGEKAPAHIHLAHANLPPCGEGEALRLFIADELLENDVPPDALLKAQGFNPVALELLKYPGQPRISAGNGRESGRFTYGRADAIPAALRGSKERRGHRGSVFDGIRSFLEWLRERRTPKQSEPAPEETAKPESELPKESRPERQTSNPSDFVGQDFGTLGIGVEKPEIDLTDLRRHGSVRSEQRGVSMEDMQNTISDPLIVLKQSQGQYLYLSDRAVVVLTPSGEVITTYPESYFDERIRAILDLVHSRNSQ